MTKYQFSKPEIDLIENALVPVAVYQFIDSHVVTVALSRGFCEMFGFADNLADAYFVMDNDMYRDAHPDDVARVSEIAIRFATQGGDYEAIYRSRLYGETEYRIVHSQGYHVTRPTGERLAVIWYTDEGFYHAEGEGFNSGLNERLNNALHRESLLQDSCYDNLTGLPNMSYFFKLSEIGRDKLLDSSRQPAMVYFDLNGMKNFNNQYGYAEGDKLLREFAGILSRHFGHDCCGRFGGDHFVVYADDDGLKEKLKEVFEDCRSMNNGRTLTVRAGIFLKIIGKTIDAGVACDRAKAAADAVNTPYVSGYKYFDEEMQAAIEHKQYIIENFDRALKENWIKVYYQPIVRAVNGRVCDEEGLARWIDPVRGFLSPAQFIPIIEEAQLTYKLDLYVLEQILAKIKSQTEAGLYIVPQSLNLSRYDFEACDIVEEIRRRVDDAGVSHDKITIEVTESVIGSDFDFMKKQVERFHELGFNVWMDDFGSDYSSLDYLQSIPFDLIKLDMRFMKQFYQSEKTRIILTELVRMAMNLGLETVCEGVENRAQAEFLREIGCTKLQGFFYCKPIPSEEIIERNRKGIQIGFENPEESAYYEAIGKVNLYDLGGLEREASDDMQQYFNTTPMAVVEYKDNTIKTIRSNKSYRELLGKIKNSPTAPFVGAVKKCGEDGITMILDEELEDGFTIHTYLKKIATNPVTGRPAVATAVLATTDNRGDASHLTFTSVAKALSIDFFAMFYLNMENETFVQYNGADDYGEMAPERHGTDFFSVARAAAKTDIFKEDLEVFLAEFTRENMIRKIDENGMFTLTYRQMVEGKPVFVTMKATRLGKDNKHIIIGVTLSDVHI